MIARSWSARASHAGASAYEVFFRAQLLPALARIAGHRGALVMTRAIGPDEVSITVVTFWETMDAVTRFAGEAPERAVVEPEARALLTSFDEEDAHHVVRIDSMHG